MQSRCKTILIGKHAKRAQLRRCECIAADFCHDSPNEQPALTRGAEQEGKLHTQNLPKSQSGMRRVSMANVPAVDAGLSLSPSSQWALVPQTTGKLSSMQAVVAALVTAGAAVTVIAVAYYLCIFTLDGR